MQEWPKDKLLKHGPSLAMAERIRGYSGLGLRCAASALVDTLDPAEIELWFADSAFRSHRLKRAIQAVAQLPEDTALPSPFTETDPD